MLERRKPLGATEGRIDGPEPTFRLLGLGDSTIAGVGCTEPAEAITGAHWSGPRFFGLIGDGPERIFA